MVMYNKGKRERLLMRDRSILERLINEGDCLKRCIKLSEGYTEDMIEAEYRIGPEYRMWVSKCTLFLETNYSDNLLTKKFIYASMSNTIENYDAMLKILKAIEGLEGTEIALCDTWEEALG